MAAYAGLLAGDGVERGLIGPREVYREEMERPVYRFDGRILEFDPDHSDTHRWVRAVNQGYGASDGWAVQGNDYATWTRLVPVSLVKAYR